MLCPSQASSGMYNTERKDKHTTNSVKWAVIGWYCYTNQVKGLHKFTHLNAKIRGFLSGLTWSLPSGCRFLYGWPPLLVPPLLHHSLSPPIALSMSPPAQPSFSKVELKHSSFASRSSASRILVPHSLGTWLALHFTISWWLHVKWIYQLVGIFF